VIRPAYRPTQEQLQAAEDLINAMDLMQAAVDEDGHVSLFVHT
jgi:Tfp pilus assembly protein PilW